MPSASIKTIRQLIYYQYAKIISDASGLGKKNYAMIIATEQKLVSGEIKWSSAVHEWLKEHENPNVCIYCGAKENLTTEHILPRCCGGEDIPENVVRVCKHCNSKKGKKRMYEYFGYKNKDDINYIAVSKYLKYLYTLHERNGTLDCLVTDMCPNCDMQALCEKECHSEKLTVYCMEGCFKRKIKE